MRMKHQSFIIISLFLLMGCSHQPMTDSPNQSSKTEKQNHIENTKYQHTTSDQFINQDIANEAKQYLSRSEDMKAIQAVNTENYLVVALTIHHHKRFQLDRLEKHYAKMIKKKFPNIHTTVSTDQKVSIELSKLEKAINTNKISNRKLKKDVNHIIKLTKEKT